MILSIISKLSSRLSRILSNKRGRNFADGIEAITDKFHRELNNVNFNIETNGEMRVLRILSAFDPKCIMDVGANIGEWSTLASKMFGNCVIHAFEIVPSTYNTLLQNTTGLNNVIINNFGLSDNEELIPIHLSAESAMATGFKIEGMKFHDEYYKEKIYCQVRKAADYLRESKIGSIDFVKIDVEGMDLRVIKGFENDLFMVRAIQFEYGIFNISSHDLLADFCRYLNSKGFIVGKIFPNTVKFFEYKMEMENFHGSNFIAVKKDERVLIDRLSQYDA